MPNGGTDCCGTCWWFAPKMVEMKFATSPGATREIPPWCTIRRIRIDDPFWTYCANHPYRHGEPDPIPIGGVERGDGGYHNVRWRAYPPENGPVVRAHLGALLERQAAAEEERAPEIMQRASIATTIGEPLPPDASPMEYPLGSGLIDTIVAHAVQIRALEAVPGLVALAQADQESRPQLLGAAHEIAEAWGASITTARRPAVVPDPVPHENCYWALPGVLAGEYPYHHIEALRTAGTKQYIDLTTSKDNLKPYADNLVENEKHHPVRVRDSEPPRWEQIMAVDALVRGAHGITYLHCWGGQGRTGCVVAGLRMLRGETAAQALGAVEAGWRTTAKARKNPGRISPENATQRNAILEWEANL